MLNTKKRVIVVIFVVIGALTGLAGVGLARLFDINQADPLFYDREKFVNYHYHNGTDDGDLSFEVISIGDETSMVRGTVNGAPTTFEVTHDGKFMNSSGKQVFFWLHGIEGTFELVFQGVSHYNTTHEIIDPVGLIGVKNETYNLTILDYVNYWSLEPDLDGAQAAAKYEVRNGSGVLVAEGILDITCGLIFTMQISYGNLKTIEIYSTNYEISRNRYSHINAAIPTAIILPVVCYLLLWKVKKLKVENKDERLEMTVLVALAGATLLVDVHVDVWFYAKLGSLGANLLLHSAMLGVLAAFCIWKKYGLKWIVPGILEFGFIMGMSLADHSYVSYLTAFMGLLISWF
ncbi:MAG: hypothetical protein ACFFCS_26050, partial [Candidatus Hodarchaeota archaeon]